MSELTFDARTELLVEAIGERIRALDSALASDDQSYSAQGLREQKDVLVGAIAKIDSGDLYGLEASEARAVEAAVRYTVEHGQASPEIEELEEAGQWFNENFGSRSIALDGKPELSDLADAQATPASDRRPAAFDFGR